MLGRTARFLRLFGHDTLYKNTFSDDELLDFSLKEQRTLLTRDVALYHRARKRKIEAFLLPQKSHIERLSALVRDAKLSLTLDPANSRCATCNAEIAPIAKKEVYGKVPEKTYAKFNDFWICTNNNCAKIYYEGRHWIKIIEVYEEIQKKAIL